MAIYTRRGDAGETSLATGERVSKASARVEAYGTVDEANSAVGFAAAAIDDVELDRLLTFVQQRLFNCAGALAGGRVHPQSDRPAIGEADVAALETAVDRFEAATGGLDHFIIEGGCEAACRLQLARAVVRRAERRIVELSSTERIEPNVEAFVNRLSDTLFAAARYANHLAGVPETAWDPELAVPTATDGASS